MKYLQIYVLITLLFCAKGFGQNHLKLKERNIVSTDSEKYIIKVIPKEKIAKNSDVIYNSNGDTLTFKQTKKYDISNTKIMNFKTLKIKDNFKADLKLDGDKLYIYPWLFNNCDDDGKKINNYFDKNIMYIKLEDRKNYSFTNRNFQIGVFTVPVKMYLDSRLGNVNLSANAMFNFGYNFGKNKFVKFPNEKTARNYKSNYSVNFLAGITSIELDASNREDSGAPEGKVAAVSTGLSFGIHYNNFSFMLASGFDLPTSNRKDWKFSGIPWLGLGIGIDFLKFK